VTAQSEALFIGGRSGAGKSSVGYEIHAQLSAAGVRHCLIEGDQQAPAWVHRVATDDRAVTSIAAEVISLAGWTAA
jgi:adenylylsulfate kinase-like enzyme